MASGRWRMMASKWASAGRPTSQEMTSGVGIFESIGISSEVDLRTALLPLARESPPPRLRSGCATKAQNDDRSGHYFVRSILVTDGNTLPGKLSNRRL